MYDASLMTEVEWCVTEPPERATQGQEAFADREVSAGCASGALSDCLGDSTACFDHI